MRFILLPIVFALSTSAQASQSRDKDASADASIVVTGSKPDPEQIRKEARTFVREMGVAAGEKQAARWVNPVCPTVIGVELKIAAIVETKVREIAKASGARVARLPCKTNISIGFVSDGVDFMRKLTKRQTTAMFSEAPVSEREALVSGTAPIRWWYRTDVRSGDGQALGVPTMTEAPGGEGGSGGPAPSVILGNGEAPTVADFESSLIKTKSVRALTSASVVIDVNRANGLPLETVAAFAAMVSLAEIKNSATPPGSILALFDRSTPMRDLTPRDAAFLKTLYSMPLNRSAQRQRGKLVGALVDASE